MSSDYKSIGEQVGTLVQQKQAAYGDSFGKSGDIMRILYPDGISPGQMDDALAVTRMLDKLFRIATDRDAMGESPWRDIAGYALLSIRRVESKPQHPPLPCPQPQPKPHLSNQPPFTQPPGPDAF